MNKRLNNIIIVLAILSFSNAYCFAKTIGRPRMSKYLNPYELLTAEEIDYENIPWIVCCNRNNAPIYKNYGDENSIDMAKYLEVFEVKNRNKDYVFVHSKNRNIDGWMNMKNFILRGKAIIDPKTSVYHKVFLRVRVENKYSDEQGLNSLRFRNGPGEGIEKTSNQNQSEGKYTFLTKTDETPGVASLFFYVYGVHFNDKTEDYQNASKLKDADYFLIGEKSSFTTSDLDKNVIRGWIPRQSAVLWDTRQALEKIPNRLKKNHDAHKFKSRKLSNIYFSCTNEQEKQNVLEKYSGEIVRDNGEGPPSKGQILRNIVLGSKNFHNGIWSEHIGFTGRSYQGVTSSENSEAQQDFMALLHESSKYLEIFFLVDATESMEPCLKTVEKVISEIENSEELVGKTVKTVFNGAVYRDKSEGSYSYQEWNPNETSSVSEWFGNVSAYSDSGDDYPEDLFNAIIQASENWGAHPRIHRLSMRIMIILGDAGNHNNHSKENEVIEIFKENMIIPFAIHFKHNCRSSQKEKCDLETDAMQKYIDQLTRISKDKIQSIPGDEQLYGNIKQNLVSIIKALNKLREEMPKIRLGEKSFCESLCEIYYEPPCQNLIKGCKKSSVNEEKFKKYIKENPCKIPGSMSKDNNIGIFLTYLDYIKNKNPELYTYITKRPRMAFNEGFIALKKQDTYITRPILLLGRYELGKIEDSIEDITTMYRSCENDKNHDLIKDALSTILGELLQTDPDVIRFKQLENWFGNASKLLVGAEKSFLGVEELMNKMCEHPSKLWEPFLNQLEDVKDRIRTIKTNRNPSRTYLDLSDYTYYWIYPEEIFPRPASNE